MNITETLEKLSGKALKDCSDQELYLALLELVRAKSAERVKPVHGRKLYYISAEFLIGKLLSNNLINLGRSARQRRSRPSRRLLPGFAGDTEPAGRRHWPPVPLRAVPPVLRGGHPERKAGPMADRAQLGGEDRRDLSGGARRQAVYRTPL